MTWNLHKNMYREVAQTLQEARKMTRSIENAAGSLQPLSDGTERSELEKVEKAAQEISRTLTNLYNGMAAQAFGREAPDGKQV